MVQTHRIIEVCADRWLVGPVTQIIVVAEERPGWENWKYNVRLILRSCENAVNEEKPFASLPNRINRDDFQTTFCTSV